jgi:hypothetical protein
MLGRMKMSAVVENFKEEYERNNEIILLLRKNIDELPKGTIVYKKTGASSFPYLQWRDGKKIKCKFLKKGEAKKISGQIEKRKEYLTSLRKRNEDKKFLERALRGHL